MAEVQIKLGNRWKSSFHSSIRADDEKGAIDMLRAHKADAIRIKDDRKRWIEYKDHR